MTKAVFLITVDLDDDLVTLDAKRWTKSPADVLAAVISDVENRLVDSVKYRDCVARVGSELLMEPEAVRQ